MKKSLNEIAIKACKEHGVDWKIEGGKLHVLESSFNKMSNKIYNEWKEISTLDELYTALGY